MFSLFESGRCYVKLEIDVEDERDSKYVTKINILSPTLKNGHQLRVTNNTVATSICLKYTMRKNALNAHFSNAAKNFER